MRLLRFLWPSSIGGLVLGLLIAVGCGGPPAPEAAEEAAQAASRDSRPGDSARADSGSVLQATGGTMGTYYSVSIANPPESFPEDWRQRIDGELRRVNDQMSTYLSSSEISRFNRSESLDWFPVSPETAKVVAAAQDVSRASDGAFDVTVAPLVDAWNFGPAERSKRPPSDAEIDRLLKIVGYEHLESRADPPALRKAIPELRVDLSAIAKGHGVDRVLRLLVDLGCENVFVDIGGENRAVGDRGDRAWRVAIEDPNDAAREFRFAIELHDQAIATSGDYRNFFVFEGERYSHTIDPRTGRPITHGLASVSVIANDCMTADAWATALTVVGPTEGLELAERHEFPVRFVDRGPGGEFRVVESDTFPDSIFPLADAKQ